jgi:hypothetical protein
MTELHRAAPAEAVSARIESSGAAVIKNFLVPKTTPCAFCQEHSCYLFCLFQITLTLRILNPNVDGESNVKYEAIIPIRLLSDLD